MLTPQVSGLECVLESNHMKPPEQDCVRWMYHTLILWFVMVLLHSYLGHICCSSFQKHPYVSFIISNIIYYGTWWLHSIVTSCLPSAFYYDTKCHKHGPKGILETRIYFFLKFAYQSLMCSIHITATSFSWADLSIEKSLTIFHVSDFIYPLKNKIAINQEDNKMVENEEKSIICSTLIMLMTYWVFSLI